MSRHIIISNHNRIILTTGIYDLVKEHIRRKKVSPLEEEILRFQLRNAQQVPRKNLPENIVSVNTLVTVKDFETHQETIYTFVNPEKASNKNNTASILSTMGLALVGCKEGDVINWLFADGEKKIQILKVKRMA